MFRSCRRSGYRTAIHFLYGKLGRGRRTPVPACIGQFSTLNMTLMDFFSVKKIREMYPSDDGVYHGYNPGKVTTAVKRKLS